MGEPWMPPRQDFHVAYLKFSIRSPIAALGWDRNLKNVYPPPPPPVKKSWVRVLLNVDESSSVSTIWHVIYCLPNDVGEQTFIPLINLGRKWTLGWWWWWWWWWSGGDSLSSDTLVVAFCCLWLFRFLCFRRRLRSFWVWSSVPTPPLLYFAFGFIDFLFRCRFPPSFNFFSMVSSRSLLHPPGWNL